MIGKLDQDGVVADARAVIAFLEKHEATNGKVGIVGFCWGGGGGRPGGAGGAGAGRRRRVLRAVPPAEAVANIKAPCC
jgi:carboxymethylenebutenolidase